MHKLMFSDLLRDLSSAHLDTNIRQRGHTLRASLLPVGILTGEIRAELFNENFLV